MYIQVTYALLSEELTAKILYPIVYIPVTYIFLAALTPSVNFSSASFTLAFIFPTWNINRLPRYKRFRHRHSALDLFMFWYAGKKL